MSGPKKKMGRPPKKAKDRKSVRRFVLMTEDEHRQLLNSTGKLGMSQSGFMRAAAVMALNGELDLLRLIEIADD